MGLNNSGFIDRKGMFEPLPAGYIHETYKPLKTFLSGGGCRVKDHEGSLTIECPAGLTRGQHSKIVKFISYGNYHRVFVVNKSRELLINTFRKVQLWQYVKAIHSRKKLYFKFYA